MTLRNPAVRLFLLLILLCPGVCLAQQKVKKKGPMYQDEVIVVYKNLFQLRAPVGFYIYSFAQKKYEDTHLPILIGGRYERLVAAKIGVGFDLEYNYHNPLPSNLYAERSTWDRKIQEKYRDVPDYTSLIKFNPHIKFYFRKNKKATFRGVTFAFGPSILGTKVRNDLKTHYQRLVKPYDPPVYDSKTMFAISFAPGISHCWPSGVTAGASLEAFLAPYQFKQEGLFRMNVGTGAMYLNPFRFYIGYRF